MKTISTLKLKLGNKRRWIGGALLLAVAVGTWGGFDQLMPQVPGGLRNGQSRFGWYLRSGQWHADMRTAVAAAGYVFDPAYDIPLKETPATNIQLADAYLPPLPGFGVPRTHGGNRS